MAYLAVRGCGAINGVSRLHAVVSRRIFQCLFPRWPDAEVPVGHVTNGVHTPTWDSAAADSLWTKACGHERWRGTMETVGSDIRRVADAELWELRATNRLELVHYVRQRLATELAARGEEPAIAQSVFDPNTLTLGFARRFTSYKRPNQLLHDPERLVRILTNPDRPVQLVIAGKAHPDDKLGQAMVQAWVQFVRRPDVRRHAVFLSDYDLLLAERLVQGADLWLNTPRRPWEASGTSGMKVLVNGGLNLSELDGWWAEAYSPEVGWALGDGKEHGDDPAWDAAEADALYEILEQQVIPDFYTRDHDGIPTRWVLTMRESMARLTPQFSANRACARVHRQVLRGSGDGVPRACSRPRQIRSVAARLEGSSLTALGRCAIRRASGHYVRGKASLPGPGLPWRSDSGAGAGGTLCAIARWRASDPISNDARKSAARLRESIRL